MSWKEILLCILAILLSGLIWYVIVHWNGGFCPITSAIALAYFANSLYIDFIFCKYEYFGKRKNIDEQARSGDWLSCLYIADSIFVLIGSVFAVILFGITWHLLSVKICVLVLLCISIFLVVPIFQVTSRKTTLLWCILRVALYGTAQRTGYVITYFMGISTR